MLGAWTCRPQHHKHIGTQTCPSIVCKLESTAIQADQQLAGPAGFDYTDIDPTSADSMKECRHSWWKWSVP